MDCDQNREKLKRFRALPRERKHFADANVNFTISIVAMIDRTRALVLRTLSPHLPRLFLLQRALPLTPVAP